MKCYNYEINIQKSSFYGINKYWKYSFRKCPGCINHFKKEGRCDVPPNRYDGEKYNSPY